MGENDAPGAARRRLAAERAAARKVAERRRQRQRMVLLGGIAVVLLAVIAVAVVAFAGGDDDEEAAGIDLPPALLSNPNDPLAAVLANYAAGVCPPPNTAWRQARIDAQTPVAQASAEAQLATWESMCGLGQAVPDQGRGHIDQGEEHDPYNSTPPTSGPHLGSAIARWGVSEQPVANEVQVHNLEHGGVMLQYNCECPDVIALLRYFADPDTGYPTKVIAAPYPGMESEVALTAWGRIWTMSAAEVTAERVRAFIDGYVDRAPEIISAETEQLEAWRESDAPKP